MRLPEMNNLYKSEIFTQEFLGLNQNMRRDDGEFQDVRNMTLDNYPVISTRQGEKDVIVSEGNINGLHEYETGKLMAVFGNKLYYGITKDGIEGSVPDSSDYLEDSEKSFATIGKWTVIMPDKVLFDAETNLIESIEKSFTGAQGESEYEYQYLLLAMEPCDLSGKTYSFVISSTAPSTSTLWYDTNYNVLKKYSQSAQQWVEAEIPYVKLHVVISKDDYSYVAPTKQLDPELVTARNEISDFFGSLNLYNAVSMDTDGDSENYLDDYLVYGKGTDVIQEYNYIITNCHMTSWGSYEFTPYSHVFLIKNKCPELDHLVSLNNRVWGVNNDTHELFACALGQPTQWYAYAGVASDSYAVSLGIADEVTAGAAYNNSVHYFTQNKIIKIYGDYAANYQLYTMKGEGVLSGAHDSVVQVEDVLFYLSTDGIMAYRGAYPQRVDEKFLPNFFAGKRVSAGKDGSKYVLSVADGDEAVGTYVYDVGLGLWTADEMKIYQKFSQLENAMCAMADGRLVSRHERNLRKDMIGIPQENFFVLEGRTQYNWYQ